MLNTRFNTRGVLWIGIFVLPVATIFLFGLIGGFTRLDTWISGIAVGLAELAILSFVLFLLHRRRTPGAGAPFYIALGAVIGIYSLFVLLEVILLGYLYRLEEGAYFLIQLMTLIGFVVVMGLVMLAANYAGHQSRKESKGIANQQEMLQRIISTRRQLNLISSEAVPPVDQRMAELEDVIRYSDPISHGFIYEAEHVIQQHLSLLEDQITLFKQSKPDLHTALAEQSLSIIDHMIGAVQDRNSQLLKAKTGCS
ncbi:hypothetical protein JCM10914A_33520 [Paenibacillus sp. JCM 10914]|uniref:hypothetical protein n=1 Tax=Paenibacillus sp. JCM 10914 TaxID=1236974 RepID=UPI0003CCBA3F|nr:hypothetical protein [Paenibacillus sp. JCM 10914]GAE07631.1 hypothetical protein JCM10914_3869 [Paenibacillus sp. JCM 10914]